MNLHFPFVFMLNFHITSSAKNYTYVLSVSRIEAKCEELGMSLQLDVNTELYPIRVGDRFRTVLTDTLNEDGSAVSSYFPEVICIGLLLNSPFLCRL